MVQLYPHLAAQIYEFLKKRNSITLKREILDEFKDDILQNWTVTEVTEHIQLALAFLIDINKIEQYRSGYRIKTRILHLDEIYMKGLERKAHEIAQRSIIRIPFEEIRGALYNKMVSYCLFGQETLADYEQFTAESSHSGKERKITFELIANIPEQHQQINRIIGSGTKEFRRIIINSPIFEPLFPEEVLKVIPEEFIISASDATIISLPTSGITTNEPTVRSTQQLLFQIASAASWTGNISDITKGTFEIYPDLIDITDAKAYEAVEEITTLYTSDDDVPVVRDKYFKMLKMHDDLDWSTFQKHDFHLYIRDGTVVPHSYRDPRTNEGLERAKRNIAFLQARKSLYCGYVKHSSDFAFVVLISDPIFRNIFQEVLQGNFSSDVGLLSHLLNDGEVTAPIIRLDRGYNEAKGECQVPYMSFYIKIYDHVGRIDVPWFLCQDDPIGIRNKIGRIAYLLGSPEYGKTWAKNKVPFPVSIVDQHCRTIAHSFSQRVLKEYSDKVIELLKEKRKTRS